MPAYTPTGPFGNNVPPGLSNTFFNNLESWIQQAEADIGSSAISGSTSGTATLYQVFQGVFKLVIVQLNNFRNGSAPAQNIAIPVPFTTTCRGWNSSIGPVQLLKASSAQTVQQLIGFNTGADNSVSGQTTLHANWLWHCDSGPDTISFTGSQPAPAWGGQLVIIGI